MLAVSSFEEPSTTSTFALVSVASGLLGSISSTLLVISVISALSGAWTSVIVCIVWYLVGGKEGLVVAGLEENPWWILEKNL